MKKAHIVAYRLNGGEWKRYAIASCKESADERFDYVKDKPNVSHVAMLTTNPNGGKPLIVRAWGAHTSQPTDEFHEEPTEEFVG